MSKTAMVFSILLLVVASCFIAGCSSLPFSGTSAASETPPSGTPRNGDAGLSGQGLIGDSSRLRFDDAAAEIFSADRVSQWNDTPVNESAGTGGAARPEKHIKYIRGTNLDENGDASSWTYIIEHGDQFSIVTYNNGAVSMSNSPGTLQRADIVINQIMTPRDLFTKNHDLIVNTTRTGSVVTRDLSLSGGNYSLTISGHGTPRILVFDAKTGALTSSND
jgi:hypothetical protein